MPRAAVVLSGCGVFDGTEIHEAVSLLIHLSRLGVETVCFAPDREQAQTIDHYTGEVEPRRQRNALHESARIARGKENIRPLDTIEAEEFDAIFFPGGFGAAKNLCTFAVDGATCTVEPSVERAVKMFKGVGKPIGMCCIAPVIAARILGEAHGGFGCEITLGAESDASRSAAEMGATHIPKGVLEAHIDTENKLVTTPAYMCDAKVHEVYEGIGKMVEATMQMAKSGAARSVGA
ncbi:MAG: isoprenoid biosynthesis protein ElbB [Phycisphaerales bacterium]|nr:MAG: isoprenoid biosynthesis protein ElbB [Phycisphaerales bacterium]